MPSSKIQDIFTNCSDQTLRIYSLPFYKQKTVKAIQSCRTSALGGFVKKCEDCDHTEAFFHSCQNRHCPTCSGLNQYLWSEKQLENTLPIQYFHVVFTLPNELNPLVYQNQSIVYSAFFKAASETILELSALKCFLGAQVGFTTVLHTWGQTMQFHPHLHLIVTGGGISNDGLRFVQSKKKFFLPVKVVSKKFRGKFLSFLEILINENLILMPGSSSKLATMQTLQPLFDQLYNLKWVVFCKETFKTPYHVIRYLARYTQKIAISNHRIVDVNFENQTVTFHWKDYRDHYKQKLMTLSQKEFIRRFLLHILPPGFMKIRHYGILGNRNRKNRIWYCRKLLKVSQSFPIVNPEPPIILKCPICSGMMVTIFNNRLFLPSIASSTNSP